MSYHWLRFILIVTYFKSVPRSETIAFYLQDLATDMLYSGPLQDYNLAIKWATDKCVPLVREITFENAEVCFDFIFVISYLLSVLWSMSDA
jgi:hypothetical protein